MLTKCPFRLISLLSALASLSAFAASTSSTLRFFKVLLACKTSNAEVADLVLPEKDKSTIGLNKLCRTIKASPVQFPWPSDGNTGLFSAYREDTLLGTSGCHDLGKCAREGGRLVIACRCTVSPLFSLPFAVAGGGVAVGPAPLLCCRCSLLKLIVQLFICHAVIFVIIPNIKTDIFCICPCTVISTTIFFAFACTESNNLCSQLISLLTTDLFSDLNYISGGFERWALHVPQRCLTLARGPSQSGNIGQFGP
jgi:hypothetical protein